MKSIKTILVAQLALLGILLCISAPAWANLAANTQILNSATLSYWDGTQTKVATSTVTVTVALVCAAPTLTTTANQTTSYNGPTTQLTDSFTITATSNGPDTYNLSVSVTVPPAGSTNTTGPTGVPVLATVQLGATVTITGVGSPDLTHIVVPFDGTSDSIVNGIGVGSTVVINGQEKTVNAINEYPLNLPSVPLAYAVITLNSALSGVPSAGVVVGERKTVNATITAGTIIASGTDVTVNATMTATSCSGSGAAIISNVAFNTFTSGVGTLTKYVRNVFSPSGTGTPYVYGSPSASYYLSGVTAKPGDTLEYLLVSSTSAAGSVSSSVVTDTLPTAYVTFKAGVYPGTPARDITYVDEVTPTPGVHYLTQGAGDDAGVYSAGVLTVNVGGVTPPTPPAAGGTIPASSRVLVLYQVTVIP